MQVVTVPAPARAVAIAAGLPWRAVLDAYLDAALDSAHTRRNYGRHIATALGIIGVPTLDALTGADLAAYRARVVASALAPGSQGQALAAVRAFLAWAGSMGAHLLPPEVVRLALRTPRATVLTPYAVVTDAEIGALFAAATTARDRAILAVLLGAGVRAAEVVALDGGDLREDADGGALLAVRQGKGRRDRVVPINDDVAALVRAYLAATGRRMGGTGPLFLAHDRAARARGGTRLTPRAMGQLVAKLATAAGIDAKAISPHSLRHSYALRALRHGGNVVAVSKLLGHASIQTTQRYVDHLATSELRAAVPMLPHSPA